MDVSEDQPQPPSRPARNRPAPPASRRPPRGRPAGRRPPPSRGARPGPAPLRPAAGPPDQRRLVIILSILTVLVVVVAIGAFVLASGGGNGGTPGAPTPSTTAPGTPSTLAASQLVTHRDDTAGFSIKYPRAWQKADIPPDGPIRLVLLAGGLNGVSVRVDRTEVPTTVENLANIKAVTDGIVGTNPTAKVLQQREVTFNGMPGYYYLYTFTDTESGAEGAHGHYFLFKGRKMHSLVFQTIPATDFGPMAALFDQVAETFQSDPDLSGPAVTTTSAAPATTVAPG